MQFLNLSEVTDNGSRGVLVNAANIITIVRTQDTIIKMVGDEILVVQETPNEIMAALKAKGNL